MSLTPFPKLINPDPHDAEHDTIEATLRLHAERIQAHDKRIERVENASARLAESADELRSMLGSVATKSDLNHLRNDMVTAIQNNVGAGPMPRGMLVYLLLIVAIVLIAVAVVGHG